MLIVSKNTLLDLKRKNKVPKLCFAKTEGEIRKEL